MATADSGSGPVSLFGVSDKLQSKVNSFREVIERKKLEVRRVCKEMRSLIKNKEEAIVRALDAIWEEVIAEMEKKKTEAQKENEKIRAHKTEMLRKSKILNPTPKKPKIEISDSIDSLKTEMDIDIPKVRLKWRVEELKNCIIRMCRFEQQILVYNENSPYQLK